jgi:NitT/TauT family transport system substrate-binding protein
VAIAKSQGANVTYVMAQYQKYPVGAMWLKDGGPAITSPGDLKGKNIGISVPGSATDIGLRALLKVGHLSTNDVKVSAIGFTETEALIDRQIDVAMTFVDNEPVQAAALGHPVNVMPVSKYMKLIGSGIVTSTRMVRNNPRLVQAFVTASLKGLRYTLQHPAQAFTIAMKRQPEVTDPKQIDIQRQVLAARLTFQQPPEGHPLGWSSPAGWKTTITLLRQIGLIKRDVTVKAVSTSIFTNTFAKRARA